MAEKGLTATCFCIRSVEDSCSSFVQVYLFTLLVNSGQYPFSPCLFTPIRWSCFEPLPDSNFWLCCLFYFREQAFHFSLSPTIQTTQDSKCTSWSSYNDWPHLLGAPVDTPVSGPMRETWHCSEHDKFPTNILNSCQINKYCTCNRTWKCAAKRHVPMKLANPLTPKSDQLQFSLSVSHQRYIIQYGEFGSR